MPSNACLLVTKLALIAQYYKFKQFTNILILIKSINKPENNTLHIFTVRKCRVK